MPYGSVPRSDCERIGLTRNGRGLANQSLDPTLAGHSRAADIKLPVERISLYGIANGPHTLNLNRPRKIRAVDDAIEVGRTRGGIR